MTSDAFSTISFLDLLGSFGCVSVVILSWFCRDSVMWQTSDCLWKAAPWRCATRRYVAEKMTKVDKRHFDTSLETHDILPRNIHAQQRRSSGSRSSTRGRLQWICQSFHVFWRSPVFWDPPFKGWQRTSENIQQRAFFAHPRTKAWNSCPVEWSEVYAP